MRNISHTVYKFEELSKKGQKQAIENWRGEGHEFTNGEEYVDSLKKFCETLGITLRDYSLSAYSYSSVDWEYEPDNFALEDLSGMRLRTWIYNNWYDKLKVGEWYHKNTTGNSYVQRYSNISFDIMSCPFTGVCSDNDLIYPIEKFIQKPDNSNLKELIEACMDSFVKAYQADEEDQDSDEAIKDKIEANEYEFTEDGVLKA